MKSILPKQAQSNGDKHMYSVIGPGTKIILLTRKIPTPQHNTTLPKRKSLKLNKHSFPSAQPVVDIGPKIVDQVTDKLSIVPKVESLTAEKSNKKVRRVKGITGKESVILPPEDLKLLKDFITSYMTNPDILLTPQLAFYKRFIEHLGAKVPTSSGNKGSAHIAEPKKPASHEKTKEDVDPTKEYKCSKCDTICISIYHLESHMKIHNEVKEKPYMCSICGKRFLYAISLTGHMLSHTGDKPYKCIHCDRAFKSKMLCINHTRMIHTGERPHKCMHCDKAFSIKFKLKIHLSTHTGDKPHKCMTCDKAFASKGNLKVHMRIHSGERQFMCQKCGKDFKHNSVLIKHMRTHTGERPYKCTQCELTFAWQGHLTAHMRVHTGERPYQCKLCGNAFAQSFALKKHARTHTEERPYQCSQCEKNFKYTSSLNEHMKKIHNNDTQVVRNQAQTETRFDGNIKYTSSLNENMKINSDNIDAANNATVMVSHMHNVENPDHTTVLLPMTGIQEYSRYPWYNGRVGWDNFKKSHNPGNTGMWNKW